MIPIQKVKSIVNTYEILEKELASGNIDKKDFVKKSKEYSSIGEVINEAKGYLSFEKEKIELEKIIDDKESDKEMTQLAKKELSELIEKKKTYEKILRIYLLPKDEADAKNAILEIRAGTGGDEAGLFVADLYKMYEKVCINKKWAFDGRLSRIASDGYIDRSSSDLKSIYLQGGYFGEEESLKAIIFSGNERTYQSWYGVPKKYLWTIYWKNYRDYPFKFIKIMKNKSKYIDIFIKSLSIDKKNFNEKLKYNDIPEWDSIGHMTLMSSLEEAFDISIETDDIIDFSSYTKGKEILRKYKVSI